MSTSHAGAPGCVFWAASVERGQGPPPASTHPPLPGPQRPRICAAASAPARPVRPVGRRAPPAGTGRPPSPGRPRCGLPPPPDTPSATGRRVRRPRREGAACGAQTHRAVPCSRRRPKLHEQRRRLHLLRPQRHVQRHLARPVPRPQRRPISHQQADDVRPGTPRPGSQRGPGAQRRRAARTGPASPPRVAACSPPRPCPARGSPPPGAAPPPGTSCGVRLEMRRRTLAASAAESGGGGGGAWTGFRSLCVSAASRGPSARPYAPTPPRPSTRARSRTRPSPRSRARLRSQGRGGSPRA